MRAMYLKLSHDEFLETEISVQGMFQVTDVAWLWKGEESEEFIVIYWSNR